MSTVRSSLDCQFLPFRNDLFDFGFSYLAQGWVCSGHSIKTHSVDETISVFISSIFESSPLIKLKIHNVKQYLLVALHSFPSRKGMFLALGCGNVNIPKAQSPQLHRLKYYCLRTFFFKESAPKSFHSGISTLPHPISSLTLAHLSLSDSINPVTGDNSQINRSILTLPLAPSGEGEKMRGEPIHHKTVRRSERDNKWRKAWWHCKTISSLGHIKTGYHLFQPWKSRLPQIPRS